MNNEKAEQKMKKALNNLIVDYPFFATLALQLPLYEKPEDHEIDTACTDGEKIIYNPVYINSLTLGEDLFILTHEVMHCALGHLWRRDNRNPELWNIATDLAINSIIKESIDGMKNKRSNLNISMIEMPKTCLYDERYKGMSADEIYSILNKTREDKQNQQGQSGQSCQNGQGKGKQKNNDGSGQNDDDKQNQNDGNGSGNGNQKQKKQNRKQNNNGNGNDDNNQNQNGNGGGNGRQKQNRGSIRANGRDYQIPTNHDSWEKADKMSDEQKNQQKIKWDSAMLSAAEAAKGKGELPAGLERGLSNIKNPQKDWRILLQEFIQEEYNDYSLMPPDKRFESEFFMFDFNDTIEVVNDILFFVDTSGSMGETAVNMCFSEIQGAINQFEKHLHGELFFFDADVAKKHYNFDDVNGNVAGLTVFGGGGTSYHCVFDYVRKHREDFNQINGIIILTDGYCDYPDEEMTDGIPVLWIYTTPEVGREKNPFGRSAILDESMFEEN